LLFCHGALREAYGGAPICDKEIPPSQAAKRLTGSNATPDFPRRNVFHNALQHQ
jgi:hypothetical protein